MKTFQFIIILGLLYMGSCQDKKPNKIEEKSNTELIETAVNEVRLNASQAQLAGIKSAKPQQKKLASTIKANGVIHLPPQNVANIHPLMAGFVKKVKAIEGKKVQQGQVLAVLVHPNYVHLQEDYLNAITQLAYSQKEFERQQKLSKGQATALKKMQQAETNLATARAEVLSLEAQLKMLGIRLSALKSGKITDEVFLRAPFSGTVSEVNINLGQYITAQTNAFEMVNKAHIHTELQVFAKDILKVYEGQKVSFKVNGNDEKIFEGEVFLIGETVDHTNNTVNVHVHPKGNVSQLKIGMFIQAELFLEAESLQVVPELSVINEEDEHYIFVDHGGFIYEMFPVQKGTIQDGYCAIEGLPENLSIVTEGANYLWASR